MLVQFWKSRLPSQKRWRRYVAHFLISSFFPSQFSAWVYIGYVLFFGQWFSAYKETPLQNCVNSSKVLKNYLFFHFFHSKSVSSRQNPVAKLKQRRNNKKTKTKFLDNLNFISRLSAGLEILSFFFARDFWKFSKNRNLESQIFNCHLEITKKEIDLENWTKSASQVCKKF